MAVAAISSMLVCARIGKSKPPRVPSPLQLTASSCRNFLSAKERKAYTSAVKCMFTLPSKADPAFAPGARNRYDDFVAVHINQTLSIHGTVSTSWRSPPRPSVINLTRGKLPDMASLLHMGFRDCPSRRVRIQGLSTGKLFLHYRPLRWHGLTLSSSIGTGSTRPMIRTATHCSMEATPA